MSRESGLDEPCLRSRLGLYILVKLMAIESQERDFLRATSKPPAPINAASNLESGVEFFLSALEARGCARSTTQAYRTDLSQFALFLHPRMHRQPAWGLRDVTGDHVRQFIDDLGVRGCKLSTIGRKVASVRSYFGFLCAVAVLGSNPATAINVSVKEKGSRPESLGRDRLQQVLGDRSAVIDFRSARNSAILEVLYGAGLQLQQLVSLNLSSLSLKERVIRLPQDHLAIGDPAAADSIRTLPLGSKAMAALNSYLMHRADMLVDRDINQIDAGALFVNERGLRLHRRSVQRLVANALPPRDDGTPSSPQLLRNSFARHLLDIGAPAGSVQAMLGQTSLSIAQRDESSIEELRAMYNRAHPRARRQAEPCDIEPPKAEGTD